MKKLYLPYALWTLVSCLPVLSCCSLEEECPGASKSDNKLKVEVTASETLASTKTTFDGETLVWNGNETMGVLIADKTSTDKTNTTSSELTIDPSTFTFSGVVNLGQFTESDIRAVTVPANPDAWVRYENDKGDYSLNIPIPTNQIQYADGVMNGDNFPLSCMITDEIQLASRQQDGSYKFKDIQLQWECAAIRFNIYGNNSGMRYDEKLSSITVRFSDSSKTSVTLSDEVYAFGKTKSNGIKIFMAIPPCPADIDRVTVYTDKARYTLKGVGQPLKVLSGSDARGNVYQLGLNFSKFTRSENMEEEPDPLMVTGTLTYDDGTPAPGVSVSDGFRVVQTDNNGAYRLEICQDTYYIYYSIPSDCEVQVNEYGQPAFFTRYSKDQSTYDFTLKRRSGGKEDKFTLFCLADPQCKANHLTRFEQESVVAIKSHSATYGQPCYGVTLGDVVYSEGNRNNVPEMDDMRDLMHKDKVGMPVFQVIGNHDYTYFRDSEPINSDETSSTFNLKAQRAFEEVFGPVDYSWNRGDVHIVCMRDIQWNSNTTASDYDTKFTDDQYEWLAQDLASVSKDKMVILCIHIPLVGVKRSDTSNNVQKVLDLLKEFKEVHIMAGHTHYMRNVPDLEEGIYEHIHAAVSGCWWYSRVNGDGSPNGYGVYEIEGNTIKNWYYRGVNKDMNSRYYQLRLYRGNIQGGGEYEKFAVQYGDGVILANVFNADSDWKIKVYEDGVYSGDMTLIPHVSKSKDTPQIGNPSITADNTSRDWWAIGYHVGVVGRGHAGGTRSNYITACYHMYKYTLKNKNSKVQVEATDRFGRTYVANQITGDYDYSIMSK